MALVALPNPNRPFPFSRLRQSMLAGAIQEGVVNAGDFKVTQRAAGANMSVDVAAGQAFIRTDIDVPDGLAYIYNDAVANVAVAASNATLPRVDRVTARYNDSTAGTGAGDDPTIAVLTGTATTGATLDNLTGAAAVTTDSVLLADILVPAASTSVTTANIRDRRPWARGAFWQGSLASDVNATAQSTPNLAHAALQARIEVTTGMIRCQLDAFSILHSVSGAFTRVAVLDGTTLIAGTLHRQHTPGAAFDSNATHMWTITGLSVGSHLIGLGFDASLATGTLVSPIRFTVEEVVRPNTSNT